MWIFEFFVCVNSQSSSRWEPAKWLFRHVRCGDNGGKCQCFWWYHMRQQTCILFLILIPWKLPLSIRTNQTTVGISWTVPFSPHITSHAHQKPTVFLPRLQSGGGFFGAVAVAGVGAQYSALLYNAIYEVLWFFFCNSTEYFETLTRNTIASSRVYVNIGVCLNSFFWYWCGNFQLCLKLD